MNKEIICKIIVCMLGILLAVLVFYNKGVYAVAPSNVKVKISVSSVNVNKDTATNIYYSTSMYYGDKVKWQVSDKSIAKAAVCYDENRIKIYGLKPGTTTIKVWLNNGNSSTCIIRVKDPTTVRFNYSSIKVYKGGSYSLYYSMSMYYGGKVTWKINDPSIATASVDYEKKRVKIYGHKHGTTSIKIWLENGNYSICNITVIDLTKVRFSNESVSVNKGEMSTIYYSTTMYYSGVVSWKINNPSIATASVDYEKRRIKIYGHKAGTTSIRIWLENGNSATCIITVFDPTTIKLLTEKVNVKNEETATIYYSTNKYYDGIVSWKIKDGSIATASVDYKKRKINIYGHKAGTTSIKIWLENGNSSTSTINVLDNSKIEFSHNVIEMEEGETRTLSYSTSKYYGGKVTWSIKDKKIAGGEADYSKNQITITGKNAGETSIKISLENGNSSICTINVESRIIQSAKKIKKYIAENGYEYCLGSENRYNGCEHDYDNHDCGLTLNYEDSKKRGKEGYHNTCCATFVSWVLIDAGIVPQSAGTNTADLVAIRNSGKFYEQKSNFKASDIRAGDILIYTDGVYKHAHVEIAAKDGATNNKAFVYNAGGYGSIHNEKNGGYSAYTLSSLTVKLRLK